MELWVADFDPGIKMMRKTVIWVRMLDLQVEFWQLKMLMGIISKTGKLVALDDFMIRYYKTGFAKLKVEIG